jgi:hypothetical protein
MFLQIKGLQSEMSWDEGDFESDMVLSRRYTNTFQSYFKWRNAMDGLTDGPCS